MKSKEKYIIDQIQNHREAVDTDDLWGSISGSIPQQEKKRRGFFWFWAGLLLVATAGLGYGYMNTNVDDSVNISTSNMNSHQNITKQSSPTAQENRANDIPNIGLEVAKEIIPIANSEKLSTTTEPENSIDNILSKKQAFINSEIEGLSRSLVLDEHTSSDDIDNEIGNPNSQNKRRIMLQYKEELNSELGVRNSSVDRKSARPEFIFAALITKGSLLFDIDQANINIPSPEPAMIDLIEEESLRPNRWSVFLESGASMVSRQLTISDIEFADAINRRNDTETVLGGWNLTVGVTYDFNSYLSVSSGLSMDQIFERSEFRTSFLREVAEESVTTIVHKQDGSITSLSESVLLQSQRETSELRNNKITFISIPVTLGMKLIENDHFSFGINGTFGYSIAQRYSGYISYSENESSYDLGIDADNNFNRSGALFYGLELEMNKSISELWSISTGIRTRKSSNIHTKINPIEQSYLLNTIGIGITKKF